MMALSGVRSSWLIVARNWDFALLAAAASLERARKLALGRFKSRDMLAQPRRFAGRAFGQMVIDDGPDESEANDQDSDRCDRHGEPFGRDRLRGHRDRSDRAKT